MKITNIERGGLLTMLTPETKKIISEQLCLIATVNKQGKPNVAPKGTMKVLRVGIY